MAGQPQPSRVAGLLGNKPRVDEVLVGRADTLKELAALVAAVDITVVGGPPGIGKSRLVGEFVRHGGISGTYPLSLWLDCSSPSSVDEQLQRLDLPSELIRAGVARDARTLLERLSRCSPTGELLLVLDDAPSLGEIQLLLPAVGRARVIVTTVNPVDVPPAWTA